MQSAPELMRGPVGRSTRRVARLATYTALLVCLGSMRASTVRAQQLLAYSFTDPVGDQTGAVDVTSMFLFFDSKGNYQIFLTADSSHPFVGKFRVNINLFNLDADPNDSAFSDACTKKCGAFGGNTDYDILTPTMKLKITGRDPVLIHWAAGDRVVTSSFAGLTPGLLFRSGVDSFPLTFLTNEDCIACDGTGVAIGQLSFPRRGWILPPP